MLKISANLKFTKISEKKTNKKKAKQKQKINKVYGSKQSKPKKDINPSHIIISRITEYIYQLPSITVFSRYIEGGCLG